MNKSNVFWGTILIIAGTLFLLDNFGIISVKIGLLWPIFLIVLGVFILIGRNWMGDDAGELKEISVPLGDAKEARVRVEHGAGSIRVSGAAKSENLLEGKFYSLDLKSDLRNGKAEVRLHSTTDFNPSWIFPWNWGGARRQWNFSLNPNIPLDLDVDSGASEVKLDLSTLKVRSLDLDTGASSVEITMPENAGYTDAKIDAGASSINVTVPKGVAARIRVESGLGAVNVDQTRFPRAGKGYESSDYATAANKVDLRVEVGAKFSKHSLVRSIQCSKIIAISSALF